MRSAALFGALLALPGCHLFVSHSPTSSDAAGGDRAGAELSTSRDGARDPGASREGSVSAEGAIKRDAGPGTDLAPGKDLAQDAKLAKDLLPSKDAVLDKDGIGKDGGSPPLSPVCNSVGWCWENPLPQGNTLYGIWGTSKNDLYAVGDGRTILHSNGLGWSRVDLLNPPQIFYGIFGFGAAAYAVGTTGAIFELKAGSWTATTDSQVTANSNALRAIWGTSATDLYAVGAGGIILHRGPGSWSKVLTASSENFNTVWGSGSNDVYVGGDNGLLIHWTGSGWNPITTGTPLPITAIGGLGPSEVYFGTALGLFQLDPGSKTTALISTAIGVTAIFAQGSTLVAAGAYGELMVKSGPTGWSGPTNVPMAQDLHAGWGSGSDRFLVGHAGVIAQHNGASYLNAYNRVTVEDLRGTWRAPSGELFAVGGTSNGKLFRRELSGKWAQIAIGTVPPLRAVWGKTASLFYLAGDSGTLIEINGTMPKLLATGTSSPLRGVWCPSTGTQLYVVGDSGLVRKFDGAAWATIYLGTSMNLNAVWGKNASDLYVAGDSATAYHFNGTAWYKINAPTTGASLRGVWADSAGNAYFAGTGGTVLRWPGGSSNASPVTVGTVQTLNAISGNPASGTIVAAGDLGAVVIGSGGGSFLPSVTSFGSHLHAVDATGSQIFVAGATGAVLRKP